MLARVGMGRPRGRQWLIGAAHGLFLLGTCLLVWTGHRRVFMAAGFGLDQFVEGALLGFLELNVTRREFGKSAGGEARSESLADRAPQPASPG